MLPEWADEKFLKEMVTVMVDDLHVRRLRQVWNHIVERLGPSSERLIDWSTPKTNAPAGEDGGAGI